METEGLKCHGCGSSNVVFEPKLRILRCHQCGKEEYYSRATLNTNGKVAYARKNAISFFKEGRLDDSKHYAMEVLNISMDNAPALYILAYYDEFVLRKPDSMRMFFEQIQHVPLEYDEIRDMSDLLTVSACNLADFEVEVIRLLASNMQSPVDVQELCGILDTICPFLIVKRVSSAYLTKELEETYCELARRCNIPKTCFALLKTIDTNPDSPYAGNSFYLKNKTQYFYDHYVASVGRILQEIGDDELKAKFMGAFKNKCHQFKVDAGII